MENTIHCFVVDTIEVVISSFKGLVAVLFLPTIKWNRNQKFIYPPGLCNLSQIHFHHNHLSGWSKTQRIWKKKTLQATELTSTLIRIYFILYSFIYEFLFLLWPFFLCLVLPPLAPLPSPPPMKTETNLRSIILNQYLWVCVWDIRINEKVETNQ